MWATLLVFEHNNLDGLTLSAVTKYGQTPFRSWREQGQSAIVIEELRLNILGQESLLQGLFRRGTRASDTTGSKLNGTVSAASVPLGARDTGSEPLPVAAAGLAAFPAPAVAA